MAVNFPQNPEIDDSFESRGVIYSWDGTRWVSAFQPNVDYKGPKGDTGATGAQGPNDQLDITTAPDVNENRPILFAGSTASTGTVSVQSEQMFFNPGNNELDVQRTNSLLNVLTQAHSTAGRNWQDSNEFTDDRIGGTEGFYTEINLSGQGFYQQLAVFPVAPFARIKASVTFTSDNHGSVTEENTIFNNFDGTPPSLFGFQGNEIDFTSGQHVSEVIPRSAGGNPNMAILTYVESAGFIGWYVVCKLDGITITGQANTIIDFTYVSDYSS